MSDLTILAAHLRPALLSLDENTLARCAEWVAALGARPGDTSDLVLAAHNHFPNDLLERLESFLHSAHANFIVGRKRSLIAQLSAATVMRLIEASGKDDKKAVVTALYVRSAAFIGMEPVVHQLAATASECLTRVGSKVRLPISAPKTAASSRRRGGGKVSDNGEPITAQALRSELASRDATISALQKRTEHLDDLHNEHLDLIGEQIDLLRWVQDVSSARMNLLWNSMDPLDKAIAAGLEVGRILRRAPASRAIAASLANVPDLINETHGTYGIADIAKAMTRHSLTAPEPRTSTLMPLLSAAHVAANNEDAITVSALDELYGLDAAWRRSPIDIAEQLLVEQSLEMISS